VNLGIRGAWRREVPWSVIGIPCECESDGPIDLLTQTGQHVPSRRREWLGFGRAVVDGGPDAARSLPPRTPPHGPISDSPRSISREPSILQLTLSNLPSRARPSPKAFERFAPAAVPSCTLPVNYRVLCHREAPSRSTLPKHPPEAPSRSTAARTAAQLDGPVEPSSRCFSACL
jgi:hypothetical protein